MSYQKYNDPLNCNRKDFLKYAGIEVAAFAFGGMAVLSSDPGAASMAHVNSDEHDTDVLIVYGGIVATFAAIKARQQGVKLPKLLLSRLKLVQVGITNLQEK